MKKEVKELATKHDGVGKSRVDLVNPEFITEIGYVLEYGANKYGENNWRKGFKWMRIYASTLRHLFAWAMDEDTDEESGFTHLSHAAANIIRQLYGENKKNLREISILYSTSISTVKRIVDNDLFKNYFYTPTKRDFDCSLGSLMKSEGFGRSSKSTVVDTYTISSCWLWDDARPKLRWSQLSLPMRRTVSWKPPRGTHINFTGCLRTNRSPY